MSINAYEQMAMGVSSAFSKGGSLQSTITRILPHAVARSLCPTGSRLAHLYGLPKTHKEK